MALVLSDLKELRERRRRSRSRRPRYERDDRRNDDPLDYCIDNFAAVTQLYNALSEDQKRQTKEIEDKAKEKPKKAEASMLQVLIMLLAIQPVLLIGVGALVVYALK